MPSAARSRVVRRTLAVATAGVAASALGVVLTPVPASADHGALPDGRRVRNRRQYPAEAVSLRP
jgi:hypothetical protein